MGEKVFKTYNIGSDGIELSVKIVFREGDYVRTYILETPELGEGTLALLNNMKGSIIMDSGVRADKVIDYKSIDSVKAQFRQAAKKVFDKELPKLEIETREMLTQILMNDMLGLGKIDFLLLDGNLEEIVANNATEPAWVYHKEFGWLRTNVFFDSEDQILNYANIIARRGGKQITVLNPLLDTHLVSGDRANATLFPISGKGNTITIRRFRREPWTVTDFMRNKTTTSDVMALVWLCIQYEMNMILSGGTASGKTSFLNICLPFIQPNHRVITIEDSVSGESEILYEQDGKISKTTVGGLIDGVIENDSLEDCVVENDYGIKILSAAGNSRMEWKEPSHLIRHKVSKDLLKITTKSGRIVEVTPDHSLFGMDQQGNISEVSGKDIGPGYWLAVPRKTEWAGKKVVFDLRAHMHAFEGCFVRSLEIKNLVSDSSAELDEMFSGNSIRHASRMNLASTGMAIELQRLPEQGFIASRLGTKIPLKVEVDEDLACLAGLWLADGCYDRNSILISVVEPEARAVVERTAERFGIKTRMHSDGITLMINSKPMKQFFENVLELRGNAYTKKIPDWVFDLDKKLCAAVLRGYFSGDGWVRKNDIVIRSCSPELLKGVQTLMLRFGIQFRIGWKMLKDKTYEGRVSGTEFLRKYAVEIGFVVDKKTGNSKKWLTAKSHDVSDVIPLPKQFYKDIKKARKKEVGNTLTYKSWKSWSASYRKMNIGRNTLRKIVEKYSEELPRKLSELAFNDIFWDPVASVERRPFEGFVYDFSVPGNENFVCGNILCHNTRELILPEFLHWVPMTTREANAEGKGEVRMLDLLVNSLRQRPDRIIVGETRRQSEAEVMFEAMHTGHSVYTTFHANTAEETIRRFTSPPIDIPPTVLDSVHLNVVMFRNRRLGVRRVLQVAEFVPEKRGGAETLKANTLYRWRAGNDVIAKDSESIRLYDELGLHTGLSYNEIDKDLAQKKKILDWLVKNDMHNVHEVGAVMAHYYMDPQEVMKFVDAERKPDFV